MAKVKVYKVLTIETEFGQPRARTHYVEAKNDKQAKKNAMNLYYIDKWQIRNVTEATGLCN